MEEEWKPIKDYEGLYEVSSLGRVKSLKFNKEKILKPRLNYLGYFIVGITKEKNQKTITIHQLVAIAFLNHVPCGHKIVVDHINDNKKDNRLENLQMITQRENAFKTQGKYSSKYKGVSFKKELKKWQSYLFNNKKLIHLGYFKCELAAHLAYQNKLKELI